MVFRCLAHRRCPWVDRDQPSTCLVVVLLHMVLLLGGVVLLLHMVSNRIIIHLERKVRLVMDITMVGETIGSDHF